MTQSKKAEWTTAEAQKINFADEQIAMQGQKKEVITRCCLTLVMTFLLILGGLIWLVATAWMSAVWYEVISTQESETRMAYRREYIRKYVRVPKHPMLSICNGQDPDRKSVV